MYGTYTMAADDATLRAELATALAKLEIADAEIARYNASKAASVLRSRRWQARNAERMVAYRKARYERTRAAALAAREAAAAALEDAEQVAE